jgi:hypothetical protein
MGNDTSASANQGKNPPNQANRGNQARNANQGRANQGRRNKGNKGRNNQGNQANQQGRGLDNQGRNVNNQGRGTPAANVNQSASNPALNQQNGQEAIPFNTGAMANQEIPNVLNGISGTGTPINPDQANMANAIKNNNAGRKIGQTRDLYFNAFKRANKKAANVKLVNLQCLRNKWKKYENDDWGYDIPVSPVNAALKSCVYKFVPGRPGRYDSLIGINPGVPQNTGIVPPQLVAQAQQIAMENQLPTATAPAQVTTVMTENPIVVPEETNNIIVAPSVDAQLVERFLVGVDSNNQNMRYFLWITLILLIIIIIGFVYKSKKEKMIVSV